MVAQLPQGGGQGETAKAQEDAAQIRGLLKAGELEPKAVKIAACWGLRSAQLALNVPHHSFALWGTPKQTLRSMADAEIPRPVLTRL